MLPPVSVNPSSSTDATSGVGGIGAQNFNFGGNPNAGFLTGNSGVSPWLVGGFALTGIVIVYLLWKGRP